MPLVSIITPAFNAEATLLQTINSVRQQDYKNYEHLIIDDGSHDLTPEIVENMSRIDPRIKLFRLCENRGAAVARNVGIEFSSGDIIAFIDSDDLWLPHKLKTQIDFMRKKGVYFSYSAYKKVDKDGGVLSVVGAPETVCYKDMLKTCVIGCLTVAYDVRFFGKSYMPLLRLRQDYGMWLKMLKKVDFAYGIDEPLALYRVNKNSLSGSKLKAASYNWKVYRELEGLGVLRSGYYFSHYAVRGVLRSKYPSLARMLGLLD